ncbi:MAG: ABC transporter ATP-binding protein [Kiritimatiellia bacterium]
MIDIRNITAAYGDKKVLKNLAIRIEEGECAALIGANGAGKTTLLKAISGALKTSGKILIDGRSVRRMPCRKRAEILSVVPQNPDANTPLTGYDFVMLGRTHLIPRFSSPSVEDCRAVENAMQRTSTLFLKKRFLKKMSGGERQRLALAMAFAAHSRIILLDEATAHLDLHHRAEIMRLLRTVNHQKNVTIVMAVHDLSLASRYFGRLILLKEGRVLCDGSPDAVLTEKNIKDAYGCAVRVVKLPESLGSAVVPVDT